MLLTEEKRNEIMESVVKDLIVEYGGVSDDALIVSSKLYALFERMYNETSWKVSEVTDETYKLLDKKFQTALEKSAVKNLVDEFRVKLYAYDPSKMSFSEAIANMQKRGMINIAFATGSKIVKVTIPWPKDNSDNNAKQYMWVCINHEVKHALVHNKRGYTTVSDAYTNSVYNRQNEADLFDIYIRDLYYLCDLDEVSSHLQEIYASLQRGMDLKDVPAYNRYMGAKHEFEWFDERIWHPKDIVYKSMYSEKAAAFDNIVKQSLGGSMNSKSFYQYCINGLSKFDRGFRRIMGRYNAENGYQGGSFKQYAQGEIEPQSQFVPQQKKGFFDTVKGFFSTKKG